MELSHEDIVTGILSDNEIIKIDYTDDNYSDKMYSTNPIYDLTLFLNTAEKEPSRWGNKYMFVK